MAEEGAWIERNEHQLMRNGRPYYFGGADMWYAPILASKGTMGDRKRFDRELDRLQALGISNIRLLAGAEATPDSICVVPCLQLSAGVLNDTLLDGLDYCLHALAKRRMTAVVCLTNAQTWSGGFSYYVCRAGIAVPPGCDAAGYAVLFYRSNEAQELFFHFAETLLKHKNRYSHLAYRDDPTVMAWQVAHEPSVVTANLSGAFQQFCSRAAARLKQIDPHHLVSIGLSGMDACLGNEILYNQLLNDENIDYATLHLLPLRAGWVDYSRIFEDLSNAYVQARKTLATTERLATRAGKPIVIEAFAYPRDLNRRLPATMTSSRDGFFRFVFGQVTQSQANAGSVTGCNFLGWGGEAQPTDDKWTPPVPLMTDAFTKHPGEYSVFSTDSTTLAAIREHCNMLQAAH